MPRGMWIKMLFFAFLGELILNVMPCFLLVLGLKIKGFVRSDPVSFRKMCRLTIACLRGDFGGDPSYILSFLGRYGRSAISFNMLISPHYPKGWVLSEYLTVSELKEGLAFLRSIKKPS